MTTSLLGIFGAGVLTVLSPCVLPVAPILVGGLVTEDNASRWSRLRASLWFGLGFAVVFTSLGLGLTTILKIEPLRDVYLALAAIVLGLYGLKMTGLVTTGRYFSWMDRTVSASTDRRPSLGSPRPVLFGALFALTWTPCAGPILGGVLTYVASRPDTLVPGALMLLVYAVGIATPLVLVAVASELVTPILQGLRSRLRMIERATGVALIALAASVAVQIPSAAYISLSGGTSPVGQHIEDVGAPGMRLLVFFHSEHCPTCRAMEALLPTIQRECASDQWAVTRIDVDRGDNAATVARFAVRAVPTTSLLDEHGRETLRLVGFQPVATLREAIESQLAVPCADDNAAPEAPIDGMPTCEVGHVC